MMARADSADQKRATDQALYGGTSPEHYINFEKVPPGLLKLTNR